MHRASSNKSKTKQQKSTTVKKTKSLKQSQHSQQRRPFETTIQASATSTTTSTTTLTTTPTTTRTKQHRLKSKSFTSTRRLCKDAFGLAEDGDPWRVLPQPPPRDPNPETSMSIVDFDKKNSTAAMKRNYLTPRKFDASDDEELYDFLVEEELAGAELDENGKKVVDPSFEDHTRARATFRHLTNSSVVDFTGRDERFSWLDPFNPPNLSYEHVKLLKNIDYSPLIKRANEGGMFTVEDVITILRHEKVTDGFKSAMRREHAQDPVIYAKTFDVFNRGRKPCPLCLPDPTLTQVNRIHYTNVNLLRKFVSTSGMVLPRKVSGVCASHQQKLRYAIKNAKQLALLSYTSNWHVPLSYVDPAKFPSVEDQHAAADVERERRMEIKALFDNLVADKRAQESGKTFEQIEKEKKAAAGSAAGTGDVVEGTEDAAALLALRKTENINTLTTDPAEAAKEQRNIQFQSRLKQCRDNYEARVAKANGDQDVINRLTKDFESEEKNIINDFHIEEDDAADNNAASLRRDFGDLLDLDTFDVNMTFEDFLARYNDRIAQKGIRHADHLDVLLSDSEGDVTNTVAKALRVDNVVNDMEFAADEERQQARFSGRRM